MAEIFSTSCEFELQYLEGYGLWNESCQKRKAARAALQVLWMMTSG